MNRDSIKGDWELLMKHIKYWLRKEVSKIYEKVQIMGVTNEEKKLVIYVDENRKRIQDLELVVKEITLKLDQVKYILNEPGRH
tara:strand:+ start:1641 stop:1889 length:249 start_codon:yes stop_codon:yes gene_type:complete